MLLHRGVPTSREVEQQADDFAGHFLLPYEALSREMPLRPTMSDFAMLKRRWGVSIAALIRLARRLDRITQDQYTSLFRQMSARGERLRERTFIPATKPRGLRAMAELVYGTGPAPALAAANGWSVLFAEKVLERHARANELPLRRPTLASKSAQVIDLSSVRRSRTGR